MTDESCSHEAIQYAVSGSTLPGVAAFDVWSIHAWCPTCGQRWTSEPDVRMEPSS